MLCELCSLVVKLSLNNEGPLRHYPSYQEIVVSARLGCQICAAIVTGVDEQSSIEIEQQEQSGLHSEADTQIYCKSTELGKAEKSFLHVIFEGTIFGKSHQFLPRQITTVNETFNPDKGQPIPQHSRSPACFQMISQWRTNCLENHERCNQSSAAQMPTRVLDVGTDSTPPRLFATSGQSGLYTTLSYCWGKSCQSITTSANLIARQKALYLVNLPPVFQDAITVTRELGYRYIWIDALCIVQDLMADWNIESSKMDQYYVGSSLNIIASSAKDPFDGIFDSADHLRSGLQYGRSVINAPKSTNYVEKRGWTLQEEILAPRSILFTSGFLTWLCNHDSTLEEHPFDPRRDGYLYHSTNVTRDKFLFHMPVRRNQKDRTVSQESQKDLSAKYDDEKIDIYTYFRWWYGIMNDYNLRSMSFVQDRLPGIAGLAKEFSRGVDAQYICGLWREDFINGLCWNGYGSRISSPDYRGPSWSWMSLDNDHLSKRAPYVPYFYHMFARPAINDDTARLVDSHVVYGELDSRGPIKEAVILLNGPNRKLSELPTPASYDSGHNNFGSHASHKLYDLIKCTLDAQSESKAGSPAITRPDTIYMQLRRWKPRSPPFEEVFALILEPTGRKNIRSGEYIECRRIGIAIFPNKTDLTAGWPKETVAII